jgi:hypothetical protein
MESLMSASVRVLIAALAIGALVSCVRSPDSVRPESQAAAVSVTEPGAAGPQEYYGRTEFEIPGGDALVFDHTFGEPPGVCLFSPPPRRRGPSGI